MRADLAQIEPKLKEILYQCLEEIRATKAALYLVDKEDHFELVTQYGFREGLRRQLPANDDIIDRMLTRRTPFFVNGLTSDPRFSEILYQSDTTRMLIAPIFSRAKLVGFVDMRDKAAKMPFESADLASAQKIVDEFLDLFSERRLFGQKTPPPNTVRTPQVGATSPADAPPLYMPEMRSQASEIVEEARRAIDRGLLRPPAQKTMTEEQLASLAAVLPTMLHLPGVSMVALSSFGKVSGVQSIVARGTVTDDAVESFESKLRVWQRKRGEPEVTARTAMSYPFGTRGAVIDAQHIASILSAPLHVAGVTGLVLTVAFESAPDHETRTRLETFHTQLQQLGEYAMAHSAVGTIQQRIAEKLLEPDFERYITLADHSSRVAALAERFAQVAGLPAVEVEKVRLAALLHDVGFRLLDYRSLYRKKTVTLEDMKLLREHPVVGAALIGETSLGPEIASIVLAHHERPDGTGYPRGIAGEQIPIASRIIHICEAWDAMTAADSYQTPVAASAALAKIRRMAGTQFDGDLVEKFYQLMSGS